MPKFQKKPVVVEAEQWFEHKGLNQPGVHRVLTAPSLNNGWGGDSYYRYYVITIHGEEATIQDGDWIIREPDGIHFYPCKPDIFEATYTAIAEASA